MFEIGFYFKKFVPFCRTNLYMLTHCYKGHIDRNLVEVSQATTHEYLGITGSK